MTVATKDRAKLGQRTYQAAGYVDTDALVDLAAIAAGEYRTLPAAKLAARSWLAKGATEFTVYVGTYRSDEIADAEYGVVLDAVWDRDDNDPQWHGFLAGDRIDWEQW